MARVFEASLMFARPIGVANRLMTSDLRSFRPYALSGD